MNFQHMISMGIKIKKKINDYFGNDPPWQYPTAIEFKSRSFLLLFTLFDLRYFVVLSMQDELDDVYLTIGYIYNTPAINNVQ